jgi:hypothetical protein
VAGVTKVAPRLSFPSKKRTRTSIVDGEQGESANTEHGHGAADAGEQEAEGMRPLPDLEKTTTTVSGLFHFNYFLAANPEYFNYFLFIGNLGGASSWTSYAVIHMC